LAVNTQNPPPQRLKYSQNPLSVGKIPNIRKESSRNGFSPNGTKRRVSCLGPHSTIFVLVFRHKYSA
jgi:hypothetical protein